MATSTLPRFLLVIFVSVLILSVLAEGKINPGDKLTTSSKSKWTSPNGDFAFGFRALSPGGPYLVAIWFDKIPDKTIVWSHWTDKTSFTVQEGSTLTLSETGFRLNDTQKLSDWPDNNPTSFAVMQDNGNFVLFESTSEYPTWQSFDTAKDTLLPGQNITATDFIYSKASDTDYSKGRFELAMQGDGNLVLQPVQREGVLHWAYWDNNDVMQGTPEHPSSLIFNSSGYLNLVNSKNETYINFKILDAGQGEFSRRVTLDTDGILRHYVWNKSSTSWSIVWESMPNPCDVTLQCGYKGVCRLNQNVSNLAEGTEITKNTFVCDWKQKKGKTVVVVLIALAVCSCVVLVATALIIWLRRRAPKDKGLVQQAIEIDDGPKAFSYKEIEVSTGGFSQELGKGGFGTVYKGTLSDGTPIAAKKLHKLEQELDRGEKEFRTEMRLIGNSHHKNLVQLYGFCIEGPHRILVLEFMSNGSLKDFLFQGKFLDWKLRVRIAIDIARGILYLHEECRRQIIHRDIKPANILLDENLNAKIADFGIAKLMRPNKTRTDTVGRGTVGYMSPECYRNKIITAKVDVYSFGIMLLEIICCRKASDMIVPEDEVFLPEWVYECLKNRRFQALVEIQQAEGESIDMGQLERMVMVAIWCIQEDPMLRPSIREVAGMLEGTVEVQVPPCP